MLGIFIFIFFDVEVEVEHFNELISHLAHSPSREVRDEAVEYSLFLVSI
jgi:hypothetical protein